MKPPKLDHSVPFEDRVLVAILWRLVCDTRGDAANHIRAKKALEVVLKDLERR